MKKIEHASDVVPAAMAEVFAELLLAKAAICGLAEPPRRTPSHSVPYVDARTRLGHPFPYLDSWDRSWPEPTRQLTDHRYINQSPELPEIPMLSPYSIYRRIKHDSQPSPQAERQISSSVLFSQCSRHPEAFESVEEYNAHLQRNGLPGPPRDNL